MTVEAWTLVGTGVGLALLLVGLFAWLRSDMQELKTDMKSLESDMKTGLRLLGERLGAVERDVGRVENEVAFMRGQLSLVLPALAQPRTPPAPEPGAD